MEDEVLIKYKKFLKDIEKGNISEMTIDGSHDYRTGLDFVDISAVNSGVDFNFSLDPYHKNSGKILSALELYKNDNEIVSRKDLVEKVFPKIAPLISEAIAERNDSSQGRNSDVRNDIDTLLRRLPESSRTILTLYYLEELALAEVAEILRIPKGTVKSRLHAARAEFKIQWQATEQAQQARTPTYEKGEPK